MSQRRSAASKKAPRNSSPLRNSAPIFVALGDETRLNLVAVLCIGGAMSIAQLTSGTDMTRQVVTKHLNVLAGGGLVHESRSGANGCGSSNQRDWGRRGAHLRVISQQWGRALNKLKLAVER